MTFKEFKDQLKNDAEKFLPEGTNENAISFERTTKLQGMSYPAMCVRTNGNPVGISINIGNLYNAVTREAISYNEAVEMIKQRVDTELYEEVKSMIPTIKKYAEIKNNLILQLVNSVTSADTLTTVPHIEVEDLSLVCRVLLSADKDNQATILVTNNLCKAWDISEKQLFEDAMISAPKLAPYSIMDMREVLAEMMGIDVKDGMDMGLLGGEQDSVMYVVSNRTKTNGAGVIMYPGMLDEAAKKLGGDFFILPSSVHEVLFVPDIEGADRKAFESMVTSVNSDQVSKEEQLSNNVYHYDSKSKTFELASRYEERMADAEREEADR